MPLYDYTCQNCGNEDTFMIKMDDRHNVKDIECKECKSLGTFSLKIGAPMVAYNISPGLKTSDNFNARLQEMKKTKGEGCTINTRRSQI